MSRQLDMARTVQVENFMDTVYSQNGLRIFRVTDAEVQKRGVDFVTSINGNTYYVDEKFAINYYNKPLSTYSFELYTNNTVDKMGWFNSPFMETTHYALLWFNCDDTFTNFTSYDWAIINKAKLKELLCSYGYYDGIVEDFKRHWESKMPEWDNRFYEKSGRRYMNLGSGIKICQSMTLRETPINILVPKDVLIKIAEFTYHN